MKIALSAISHPLGISHYYIIKIDKYLHKISESVIGWAWNNYVSEIITEVVNPGIQFNNLLNYEHNLLIHEHNFITLKYNF